MEPWCLYVNHFGTHRQFELLSDARNRGHDTCVTAVAVAIAVSISHSFPLPLQATTKGMRKWALFLVKDSVVHENSENFGVSRLSTTFMYYQYRNTGMGLYLVL